MQSKKIIAACYCRLSDDDEQDGTSVSIETQKKILGDYCRDFGIKDYTFFCDDGWTGTNFDRPDFIRMMKEVEQGNINTVIVKDLSRFGRNYVKIGYYLSNYFPEHNIRFIAVTENVDSARSNLDYDLMIPIKNVFNEFYPADCSHKVKLAFVAKAKNGEFIGSQAAYGLKKCESDKHMLEFDEETAPTVRWMFEMAAYHGYGYNKIARTLTQQKVLTPAAYQAFKAGREYKKDPYEWNMVTVLRMMDNETYLGHLISGKRRKLSYKSQKIIHQDESEWIVVKNQFPALISEQLWEDAHKALGNRKRESKSGSVNIFAGLIKCERCGYALGICNASDRDNYYVCNTYKKKGPEYCSAHYIRYDELYTAVLQDIQKIIASVHQNKDACIRRIAKKLGVDNISRVRTAHAEIETIQMRLTELDRRFDMMYEDRLSGTISETKFREITKRWDTEQVELQRKLESLQKQVSDVRDVEEGTRQFADMLDRYTQVENLDTELLNRLIDKIIISDRTRENGEINQKITIQYKFVGAL